MFTYFVTAAKTPPGSPLGQTLIHANKKLHKKSMRYHGIFPSDQKRTIGFSDDKARLKDFGKLSYSLNAAWGRSLQNDGGNQDVNPRLNKNW